MLGAVNLHGARVGQRRADCVGADVGLAPAPAVLEMHCATGIDDPGIALGVDDQAGGISEDHDRAGVAQERPGVLQRATRGLAKRRVLGALAKQFSLGDERRLRPIDRDAVLPRPLPRSGHCRPHVARQGAALDEFLPCGPYVALVHSGSSNVSMPAAHVASRSNACCGCHGVANRPFISRNCRIVRAVRTCYLQNVGKYVRVRQRGRRTQPVNHLARVSRPRRSSASSTLVTPDLIRLGRMRKAELIALLINHATI